MALSTVVSNKKLRSGVTPRYVGLEKYIKKYNMKAKSPMFFFFFKREELKVSTTKKEEWIKKGWEPLH